tara:strand:- start:1614 stop:1973 length:360 start_codon:yes stop_codon:yes gene_type:complete
MTVATKEENQMGIQDKGLSYQGISNPQKYSCQILQEKTTLEAANDKSLPNDARLVWYVVDGVEYIDLTRCTKTSKLFDMYYDTYGPGAVQKIDFGYGTVNPKLWGAAEKKKESKGKRER